VAGNFDIRNKRLKFFSFDLLFYISGAPLLKFSRSIFKKVSNVTFSANHKQNFLTKNPSRNFQSTCQMLLFLKSLAGYLN